MEIGEKLKKLRREKDLTLRELSEKTGISLSFISDIEHGRRKNPSIENLQKIARGLGVPTAELLAEAGYNLNPINMGSVEVKESDVPYNISKNEVAELLDTLHKRPEMKALFSASKNVSKEDIEKAIKIIEALKDN